MCCGFVEFNYFLNSKILHNYKTSFRTVTVKRLEVSLFSYIMLARTENAYCFVSGKNWKLSLAEITSYLEARGCEFEISDFSRSYFTLRTNEELDVSIIDELGGTLKIAKASAFIPTELIIEAFLKKNKQIKQQLTAHLSLSALAEKIPRADSGKSVFGVSVYWADPIYRPIGTACQRFLGSALKDELRAEGKKARFMGFPRDRENPQLTPVEVLKQGLLENHAEILLCIGKQETAIGATVAVHNPFEFQKRDIEKPVQRKIFGISPRVAKIMINLAHCGPGKVFLDPFCGVGTFLQEALLIKAKVIGLDINRWCVESAKRNLEWIAREYSLESADFWVVQGDATQLTSKIREVVNSIATEPDLGPALREIPTVPYAEKILEEVRPLFEGFVSESFKVLGEDGFLVVVTPFIKTRSGKPVTMDIQGIAQRVGFKVVRPFEKTVFVKAAADFPLREFSSFVDVDERHKIGREISIFQKIT
jgi:tRNA G10  N-methylase Trm11